MLPARRALDHGVHHVAVRSITELEELELRDVVDRIAEDLFASAILGRKLDHEAYPQV